MGEHGVRQKKQDPSLFLADSHPGISQVPPTGVGAGGSGSEAGPIPVLSSDAFAFYEERSNRKQRQNSVYRAKNSHGVNPTFP